MSTSDSAEHAGPEQAPAVPVALIIPSHERGRKIIPTLKSVMSQTRRPSEVVVVNDGACAETRATVQETFPSFTVMDVVRGGAASARNLGVAATSAPYVVLLDDDDTLRPQAVEVLCGALDRFPSAVASYADHAFTNLVTGEHLPDHFHSAPWYQRLTATPFSRASGQSRLYGRPLYRTLLEGNLLGQPWAVRRWAYEQVGGFVSGLGSADDWDLFLRITRRFPVAVVDTVISDHFREPGRSHLTTGPDQEGHQAKVLKRQLRLAGWRDPVSQVRLRRRLALFHKSRGDQAVGVDAATAAEEYRASFYWNPFDHVVAARALWYMLRPVGRRN